MFVEQITSRCRDHLVNAHHYPEHVQGKLTPGWNSECNAPNHGRRYLLFALCAAHRLRCASAIRLRASGLNTRVLRAFPADFLFLR